jgi:hypothetical protein
MIKALDTAAQGLLQAEKRATDIAKDILRSVTDRPAFTLDDGATSASTPDASAIENGVANVSAPATNYGSLIQQFSDLRAEEKAFKASATAFARIDETLGTLLDDEG